MSTKTATLEQRRDQLDQQIAREQEKAAGEQSKKLRTIRAKSVELRKSCEGLTGHDPNKLRLMMRVHQNGCMNWYAFCCECCNQVVIGERFESSTPGLNETEFRKSSYVWPR